MTLVASMKCTDGLILAADTEEVIEEAPLLKTTREKLRVLDTPIIGECRIVAGGAGEFDFIRMIGDFVEDKIAECGITIPSQGDIEKCIRSAVAEVWSDYARHEGRQISVQLLIASQCADNCSPRLTVVNGTSVRRGTEIEAIGRGDSTFKALADRFVQHGLLRTVSANLKTAVVFVVYAFLQAKLSIPGIGGQTRIVTISDEGELKYMKSWSVSTIQSFFRDIDGHIRNAVQILAHAQESDGDPLERLIGRISKGLLEDYRELKKELQRIDEDDSLI
jgi:20S proteasome alpha/beta subunit